MLLAIGLLSKKECWLYAEFRSKATIYQDRIVTAHAIDYKRKNPWMNDSASNNRIETGERHHTRVSALLRWTEVVFSYSCLFFLVKSILNWRTFGRKSIQHFERRDI